MSSSGTAPAYRRLSVDERRAQLIGAALELFAHRQPEEVSPDDVAAAAGVSRPLVYRYFPGGKQQLYEAALRSAADELKLCFAEEQSGPLTLRLRRALERYLTFVDEHDTGFMALLQGGSVVQTSRTHAIVDEVRSAAAEEVLRHLGYQTPGDAGVRLRMTVSTWITVVEAASLMWLDEERKLTSAELRDWLLDHFVAMLTASATRDEETARIVRLALPMEEGSGPVGELARRMLPVVGDQTHLLAP